MPRTLALDLGPTAHPYAVLLWLLLGLFVLRVLGQLAVALARAPWLPPMREWYSGLIPYSVLLPIQGVVILVMVWMTRAVARSEPRPAVTGDDWGRALAWFSIVYASAMFVRWIRWLRSPPAQRRAWIPIIFHLVLAAFLLVYGSWLQRG